MTKLKQQASGQKGDAKSSARTMRAGGQKDDTRPSARTVKKAAQEGAAQSEQFSATAKYVWYSPYKLRPIADVVRGKDVTYALQWLETYRTQRSVPVKKVIESAVANAKNVKNIEPAMLVIRSIQIDQGPTHRYFKPGAQGRAQVQRKRMCHLKVIVQTKV